MNLSKIPAPNNSEYPQLPDMEPIAVTITEFTGPFTSTFEGIDKQQYNAILTPTDPALSATRIFAYLTRSWHEKAGNGTAGLRNLVNAVHPKDLTQEQILEFDPDIFDFPGKSLVVFGKVNDRGYLKPVAYKRSKGPATMGPVAKAPVVEAPASEEVLAV